MGSATVSYYKIVMTHKNLSKEPMTFGLLPQIRLLLCHKLNKARRISFSITQTLSKN